MLLGHLAKILLSFGLPFRKSMRWPPPYADLRTLVDTASRRAEPLQKFVEFTECDNEDFFELAPKSWKDSNQKN